MDYNSLKSFLLNFYTRYLSSWALKALAAFLATHGASAEQSGSQAQAIIEGLLALIVAGADFYHSYKTTQKAVNDLPPTAVVHSIHADLASGTTTTTVSLTTDTATGKPITP